MRIGGVFRSQAAKASDVARVRVVAHRPMRRAMSLVTFALITLGAAAGGYYLGISVTDLDRKYLRSLEELERGNAQQVQRLREQLIDAQLNRQVTDQASAALREDIVSYRNEAARLQEEVTFYKSLMDPSSVDRGLQIAQFELTALNEANQFSYHLLLTQLEARRDWVQGEVRMEVRGRQQSAQSGDAEQVLSLTELADAEPYPLKYRFRYFQDLSGVIALPPGFLPEAVVVTVNRRGARQDNLQRSFAWETSS